MPCYRGAAAPRRATSNLCCAGRACVRRASSTVVGHIEASAADGTTVRRCHAGHRCSVGDRLTLDCDTKWRHKETRRCRCTRQIRSMACHRHTCHSGYSTPVLAAALHTRVHDHSRCATNSHIACLTCTDPRICWPSASVGGTCCRIGHCRAWRAYGSAQKLATRTDNQDTLVHLAN